MTLCIIRRGGLGVGKRVEGIQPLLLHMLSLIIKPCVNAIA